MTRRLVLVAAITLAGCTAGPVVWETGPASSPPGTWAATDAEPSAWAAGIGGSSADPVFWRTETRQKRKLTWWGAPIANWDAPEAIYFTTQYDCEMFRGAHPTYTRPDEVCVAVRGQLGSMPAWKR